MSKPISIGQSHNLIAILANNVDWSAIDSDTAQCIIDDPRRTGKNFTEFLKRLGTLPRALKSLKLIEDGIVIVTEPFTKNSFFVENGPVKFYFWDSFTNWVLKAIPETIEAFQGKLTKTQLTKGMYDSEILGELGQPKPFSIPEFAAIICDLLTKQPNGEDGTLLNNSYADIFYVKLDDARVVTVNVAWLSDDRAWHLNACGLDVGGWLDGRCVFSRS